jgi:putative ubiquitin-RnfH superfamily antitoxin RatB of RatAB toxin-antitoxin module
MASGADAISVALAVTPAPGEAFEIHVEVPAGATVTDVLRAARVEPGPGGSVGIWGRIVGGDAVVAAGDRVEVYRPLPVDAKEARRRRAAAQRQAAKRR